MFALFSLTPEQRLEFEDDNRKIDLRCFRMRSQISRDPAADPPTAMAILSKHFARAAWFETEEACHTKEYWPAFPAMKARGRESPVEIEA